MIKIEVTRQDREPIKSVIKVNTEVPVPEDQMRIAFSEALRYAGYSSRYIDEVFNQEVADVLESKLGL